MPFPSRRANRLQTLAMARELGAKLGKDFYFGTHTVSGADLSGINHREFGSTKSYVLALQCLRFAKQKQITHVLCREHRLLYFMMLYNRVWFRLPLDFTYEAHFIPEQNDWFYDQTIIKSNRVIVLT